MSSLQGIFISILNMSITASYVAVGVILVRIFLKKASKIFSYALWAVLLFRLICPVSFSSTFSFLGLLNVNFQNNMRVLDYIPYDIGFTQTPAVQLGIGSLDRAVNSSLPQVTQIASVNPIQVWMEVLSLIWFSGVAVLLFYSVISYIKIKKQLLTATLVKDNIYESDQIGTAFVCGFVHPKIYVPVGVGEADLSYILEHERTHIRRKDYLISPLAFFVLLLHWFNPLMWLSFALMSRDMEMSCDESVLQKMNQDARGGYSRSLLSLSVKRNGLFAANPLAFGESHVKSRIKNVLKYKKPVFWVVIASAIVLIGAGIALLSNPVDSEPDLSFLKPNNMLSSIGEQERIKIVSSDYGITSVSGKELAKWLDIAENDWVRKNVTSPYKLSPSITIHVNDETGNEIRFFESEPTIAMTLFQNEFRYYKIPEKDYAAMVAMAGAGYPQVQSATFTEYENGNGTTQDQSGKKAEAIDNIVSMPGFTEEEVAAARAVVEEYFRSVEEKDDEAILKTLTPMYNQPNTVLYGDETRTLTSIDYNEDDPMRKSYVEYGRGNINGTKLEDVIVFRVSFHVKYPRGVSGSFNEGDYTDWSMILVRDGKESSWLIDGQGY